MPYAKLSAIGVRWINSEASEGHGRALGKPHTARLVTPNVDNRGALVEALASPRAKAIGSRLGGASAIARS